jgi:MFS family permease
MSTTSPVTAASPALPNWSPTIWSGSLRRPDRSLTALVAEGFFSRLSFGLIAFALPLYAHELGLSIAQIGVLLSFNLVVATVLKPATGALADRVGLKRGLTAAVALRSVTSLLLAFAAAPWQLFAVRGVHGASIALRDPSVDALIAVHGKRAVATAFAWYQTAKSSAGAIGKAAAGVLLGLTASDYTLVFLVAFALASLPLVIVARYVREPAAPPPRAATHAAEPPERPALARFMGLGFLVAGTAHMLGALFPLLATEYAGLTPAQAGSIYVLVIVAPLTGPAFGWLSDNVSRRLVLAVRSIANAGSSLLYLAFPTFAGVLAGRLVDDIGKAAFRPAWGSLMAHVASFDPRTRARTMGFLRQGEDAGEIAGPMVAGVIWSVWGAPVLLVARAALALVTELYGLTVERRLPPLDEERSPKAPRRGSARDARETTA